MLCRIITWLCVVCLAISANGQGAAEDTAHKGAETLTDAQKAEVKRILNEAIVSPRGENPTSISCSAKDGTCNPLAVFISGASISTIKVTDINATKALRVRLSAGEVDQTDGKPIFVERSYTKQNGLPDKLLIAIHRARGFDATYHKAPPQFLDNVQKLFGMKPSTTVFVPAGDSADPAIAFVSLSKSDILGVQLTIDDADPTTLFIPVSYQRWFVDMGGFLTFSPISDQELATSDAGSGNVRIDKKRRKDRLLPATGIVLNFHPANYPGLATQFGLATSVDRSASYYLGLGYRLRELGPRTLATFSAGIAATQVKRFPDVKVGDIRAGTSDAITKGENRYAFGPFLSISLGFSFGGNDTAPVPATAAK